MSLETVSGKLDNGGYDDVPSYFEDLKAVWDDAAGTKHEKVAIKYKALCVAKFELFFEGLSSHRRRSKRLLSQNGALDLRRHSRRRTEDRESGGGGSGSVGGEGVGSEHGQDAECEWKTEGQGADGRDGPSTPNGASMSWRDGEGVDGGLLCPRCLKFEGKNSRSLKTHMRYCNKGDVMRYIELSTNSKGKDRCECGFTSPVPKGLQSHQLTCELIRRRLNQSQIGQIAPDSKIRMWIETQWYTGTVVRHTPSAAVPHLYEIRFRAKGEKPMPYDLEQFNFRVVAKKTAAGSPKRSGTKRRFKEIERDGTEEETPQKGEGGRGSGRKGRGKGTRQSGGGKRAPWSAEQGDEPLPRKRKKRRKVEDPHFVYLHDITRYRHQLFTRQYAAFQNYVDDWLCKTRQFLKEYD